MPKSAGYAFAFVAVAACAIARWALRPLLEAQGIYLVFMIPVASAAYLGGAGPGVLAIVLSAAVANPYLSEFPVTSEGTSATHLLLFGIEATAVVILIHKLRVSGRRTAEALTAADAARRLADHACSARDEFMARVSHEWRTPLSTISGWLWQLEQRPTDVNFVLRAAASMRRAVESQMRFVSDLLDFSRTSCGKLSVQLERLPIVEPVKAAIDTATTEIGEQKTTIHMSDEECDARVWGDPVRLQQVFTNLLQNARKFTPAGGTVSVVLVRTDGVVDVKVVDTGVGMSSDSLHTIFEPFAQSDQTRDTKRGGLGLGLSIARDIVAAHGGTLTAFSKGPGTGTTFTVRLPVATGEEPASCQ